MFNNIPLELRQLPQWACTDASKKPIDPKTGKPASVSNPATWAAYEQTVVYAMKHGLRIGFILSKDDNFTIIDLDDKADKPASEEQRQRHEMILTAFDSYTERSISGRGYHIVVRGKVPDGVRRDNVEVYSDKRFMVFTGDVVRAAPIADYQALLDRLYAEMKPQFPGERFNTPMMPTVSDGEVLSHARESNGSRFEALWSGQWKSLGIGDGSQSAADLELGIMLAHFTLDEAQWMRIFRMSALGQREKACRNDYLDRTFRASRERVADAGIQGSIEHGRLIAERILARWHTNTAALVRGFLEPFCDFIQKKTPTLKLVKGILGEGGLSVLYGAPGAGKSFLALDLGFAIATGREFVDRGTRQGPVLYAAGEGVSGLRLRGSAIAKAKGITDVPIFFLKYSLSVPDEIDKLVFMLDDVAASCGTAPILLIVDTLSRFFGDGDDENSAKDMKRFIGAIGSLLIKYPELHVMLIHHSGKDQEKGMRGSSALKGAADTVIQCRKNGDAHTAVVEKQKDGQDNISFSFSLEAVELGHDEDGEPVVSCVVVHDQNDGARALTGWLGMAAKAIRYLKQSTVSPTGNLAQFLADIQLPAFYNHMYRERPDDKRDTVRKNARRQLEKLKQLRFIEWDGKEGAIRPSPALDSVIIQEGEPHAF